MSIRIGYCDILSAKIGIFTGRVLTIAKTTVIATVARASSGEGEVNGQADDILIVERPPPQHHRLKIEVGSVATSRNIETHILPKKHSRYVRPKRPVTGQWKTTLGAEIGKNVDRQIVLRGNGSSSRRQGARIEMDQLGEAKREVRSARARGKGRAEGWREGEREHHDGGDRSGTSSPSWAGRRRKAFRLVRGASTL